MSKIKQKLKQDLNSKFFETLNNKEIQDVIVMSYRQLIEKMQKKGLDYVTIDQLIYIHHEMRKTKLFVSGDLT